jgi:broad specificity phosphatase PhoE
MISESSYAVKETEKIDSVNLKTSVSNLSDKVELEGTTHVFIRHAERDEKGKGTFELDPLILSTDIERAKQRFRMLVENGLIPSKIICSPYERTRQTAEIARKVVLEMTGKEVQIQVDIQIRDFINRKKIKKAVSSLIRDTTKKYNIPTLETVDQYSDRIVKFVEERMMELNKENIWFISHGSFINRAIQIISFGKEDVYPQTLSGYIVNIKSVRSR